MSQPLAFCHIYGQMDQTSDRFVNEFEHMFGLDLVCDTSVDFHTISRQHEVLAEVQKRGGLVSPVFYPDTLERTGADSNWWKYPTEECVRRLTAAQERFATLDLGPLESITTYTPGNGLVAACRQLGVTSILGFCAPQQLKDGGWEISHYGAPLSPYFIAEDDFRKPERPGDRPDPVLMVNMELRSPITCLRHSNEGPFCPLNARAADRTLEPGPDPLQYLAVAEDWLRVGELTGQPIFLDINLQYFFTGVCFSQNRRALEWIARQRDQGRLQAGGVKQWVAVMREAGGFLPQRSYWRGEMMGYHPGNRLGSVPDMVMEESADRQLVWQEGDNLPRRWYDYGKPWDYPGYCPDGTAPASEELPGISVEVTPRESAGATRRCSVRISNTGEARRTPLALWDLLGEAAGPFSVAAPEGWSASVIPHPAGTTGVVLLEGPAPAGETVLELTITADHTQPSGHKQRWGSLLEAQTFFHGGRPYTVLAAQTAEPFSVTVRLHRPQYSVMDPVRHESLCGLDYQDSVFPAAGARCDFDATRMACWHRFWEVTAADLEIEGVEEVEARLRERTQRLASLAPGLEIPAPGYLRFHDLKEPETWDVKLARRLGERERERMNAWFREQRPGAGEVVIEAHPGIYMPPGSQSCSLAHDFEYIRCAEGLGCEEQCADYAQAWDWGVAGWIQWRHLVISLSGLREADGPYTLHLHSFDPEGRDYEPRVYFFDPTEIPPRGEPQMTLTPGMSWPLPSGREGRWEPGALWSTRLPQACLRWAMINVHIRPLQKVKLFDWIAESGAPGLLSHLWVTRGG
ncbi:MAG TPA: hypothetical protein VGM19_14845 [Armatimonadota bacterium]|jgi:hypothetical protein